VTTKLAIMVAHSSETQQGKNFFSKTHVSICKSLDYGARVNTQSEPLRSVLLPPKLLMS